MPQPEPVIEQLTWSGLFADAEVAKNDVEDVLDIDSASESAERTGGDAQLLGQQLLALGHWPSQGAAQGGERVLKSATMALAGDERQFARR